jgi:8-oxo-dGTP pyrophosphatase MutT (NUDIX family)
MTDEVTRWLTTSTVRAEAAPHQLAGLLQAIAGARHEDLSRNDPAADRVADRQAAVLILIATEGQDGPDVLLQQRASGLNAHAGEVSYPGGARECGDAGPVETALREATEETGLDPAGVDPLALLPRVHIPPSRFDVTGVLAHWREPCAVKAIDPAETARVMRIPVSTLADPANRLIVSTDFGWRGPAFLIAGAVVWGFTGETLAAVLRFGGWERPWIATTPVGLNRAWQLAS